MKTETSKQILAYITENRQATAKELVDFLGISGRAVFKQLRKLVDDGHLKKIGRPPRVFYFLAEEDVIIDIPKVSDDVYNFIHDNYFYISPNGAEMQGMAGFADWCTVNKLPIEKTAREYINTLNKYNSFKKDGLIDGMSKLEDTFDEVFLDELYYFDFYAIERFGKTKLGTLVAYAKQSQSKALIKKIDEMIKGRMDKLIREKKIDAVGFIPPTVKREVQLQKELKKMLDLDLPVVDIVKIKTGIAVPQKSLKRIEDRIVNAKETIVVDGNKKYNNILLIDDAVGSGSTLNEVARKIKDKDLCSDKIIGVALVGSFKGFDVVSGV